MGKDPYNPQFPVWGLSPLGGNSVVEGEVQGVPLFWDNRVQNFISEQAIEELDDRDLSLIRAEEYEEEQTFRSKAGIRRL